MDPENLTWPPQTTAQDHLVVAVVWSELEQLLTGQAGPSDMFIRRLEGMLPPLASVPAQQLPGIARIHLQSAAHIKSTMCMLAPAAFPEGEGGHSTAAHAQHSSGGIFTSDDLSQHSWLALVEGFAPDRVPSAAEALVMKLIDLQVFHLCRAQEVTTHLRRHARERAQHAQAQAQAQAGAAAVTAADK